MSAKYQTTNNDIAKILDATIDIIREQGLSVGVTNAPPTDTRPGGLLLFVVGLEWEKDRVVAVEPATTPKPR